MMWFTYYARGHRGHLYFPTPSLQIPHNRGSGFATGVGGSESGAAVSSDVAVDV